MRQLLFVFGMALLAGCASSPHQPLAEQTLSTLSGKSVILIQRESPTFVAMTSGKGMFAVAGVGAAAAAGNKLVRENQINDPAIQISRSLTSNLNTRHGVVVRGESSGKTDSDAVSDIVEIAADSDYALDVVTSGWTYMYDGFKFGDYFVSYASKLRLIDVKTSEVLSAGTCAYNAKEAGKAPVSHDTLLANDAAYIKQELADAAAYCIDKFQKELFFG